MKQEGTATMGTNETTEGSAEQDGDKVMFPCGCSYDPHYIEKDGPQIWGGQHRMVERLEFCEAHDQHIRASERNKILHCEALVPGITGRLVEKYTSN